jgi:hypothetical protein
MGLALLQLHASSSFFRGGKKDKQTERNKRKEKKEKKREGKTSKPACMCIG